MKGIYFFILFVFFSCRQVYNPSVDSAGQSFLVVEGNLDPGNDTTVVHLTRTLNMYDTAKIKPEDNAEVVVEGRDNTMQILTPQGHGYYISPKLNLVISNEYRVRIKTADGKEYLSGYVKAKQAPEIDSLNWDIDTTGLRIYVSTHDPTNSTIYYRWECKETWEIRSYYFSTVVYESGTIRQRIIPPDENIFVCWKYDSSHTIELANSERLASDVIYRKPVRLIPYHNERISKRYSLLVRQYALDKGAYDFFELMKENTENIGGLFSPLPVGQLKGDIRSVSDTTDYAIGYITASTVTQKRIFISGPELIYWRFRLDCGDMIVIPNNISAIRHYIDEEGYVPFEEETFGTAVVGYKLARPAGCVDCRTRGGSTIKPDYW